jgi:hypothetical protein
MKRLFVFALLSILCLEGAMAQKVRRFGVFDHAAIGVSAGTTGVGFELAAPITDFLVLRAGYSFMPELKYSTDVHYKAAGVENETEIEGKLKYGNGHALLDIYPIPGCTFHATVGAFYGTDKLITAENKQPIIGLLPGEGLEIGDYIIGPDVDGIARAAIKVKKLKPYVGIGFGRAVPRHRVGFGANFGVQLWGSPKVYEQVTGKDVEVTSQDVGNKDGGVIKEISKISIWPVIDLKLTVRLF